MKSLFEEMIGTYRNEGDYYIPNLELPSMPYYQIGKYGRMEILVSAMAKQEGVTEALKAAKQMEWIRCMNSIRTVRAQGHASMEKPFLKVNATFPHGGRGQSPCP